MRLTFTFLLLCAILSTVFGQINIQSPFPADFIVTAPTAAAGVYDYGTMVSNADNPIWGPQLTEDLTGELVWARNATDTLGCATEGAIVNDVMGKIALIRRGTCAFSEKVRSAQEAGAIGCVIVNHYDDPTQNGTSLMGMLGTPPAADIVIPAVFIARNTGEIISAELDAGNTVSVTFDVKSFYDPVGSYSYHSPLTEAIEIDVFRVIYVNPDPVNMVEVGVTAVITAPSGASETLTSSSSVAALSNSVITLDGTYLPTELGPYTVEYSNDQNDETASASFIMTDYTYAPDSGVTSSAGPADATFSSTFAFTYQAGSLIVVDSDGARATHASFGITNAADLATGDPDSDQLAVVLYDADQDEDGLLDFPESGGSFDDLAAVALTPYTITGNEQPDELITVELEDLFTGDAFVDLKPDGSYYIVIAYNGTNAGTGVAPRFAASESVAYVPFPTTPIFLDRLYTGWSDRTVAVRLHLDGFDPVSTRDLPELASGSVNIAPNPVQEMMNVQFQFNDVASEVFVRLLDVNGKLVKTYLYDNIMESNVEIDVKTLPAGTYFLNVQTPNGFRTEKVIKQ